MQLQQIPVGTDERFSAVSVPFVANLTAVSAHPDDADLNVYEWTEQTFNSATGAT